MKKIEVRVIEAFRTIVIKDDSMISLAECDTEDKYRICKEEEYDYLCER